MLFFAFAIFFISSLGFAEEPFYRIIQGPNPGPQQAAIDRFVYGTDVLYTGDAAAKPTKVKGTVWHATLKEADFFIGTHNPVIEQQALLRLIESNKWEEAKILLKYLPDAFPKTENMAEVLKDLRIDTTTDKTTALRALRDALSKRYPNGFFLKPVDGFNSAGTFPTEKTRFEQALDGYLKDVKPRIEEMLKKTGDATETHLELKGLKNYEGRVLEAILQNPESVIVQEKIRAAIGSTVWKDGKFKTLVDEYRVHVVEGKVLRGATQTRWEDARAVSEEAFARVDAFAQKAVDALPPEMRKMCFGMDVMRTENGLFKIIELNAGGDSGYLYPEIDLWVTQLLARHFRGNGTPLQKAFRQFAHAPSFAEKERALAKLLARPEMKVLATQVEPITELLAQAKDAFFEDLKKMPTRDAAIESLAAMKKFNLERYFTANDIELIGQILTDSGRSPRQVERMLGLANNEIVYSSLSGIKVLRGINYSDAFVEERLAQLLSKKLSDPAGKLTADETLVKNAARELVEDTVVTRAQIHTSPEYAKLVAQNGADSLLKEGSRLLYSGTKEALLDGLFRTLKRL